MTLRRSLWSQLLSEQELNEAIDELIDDMAMEGIPITRSEALIALAMFEHTNLNQEPS